MKPPLVSILVTSYNVEDFIDRAINSALDQTYPHVEIIAVDDASSDSTWQRLQKYKHRIQLIRNKKRKRVSAALNIALSVAKGEYITRLDGDDQLDPTLVEKEVELLSKNSHIGFVYCDYVEVDPGGKLIREVHLPDYIPSVIHLVDYIAMGNMIRAGCYQKIGGYDEGMKKQEHYDFSIRLAREFEGAHLAEPLFFYTRRPNQATSNLDDIRYYTELIRQKYNLRPSEVVSW